MNYIIRSDGQFMNISHKQGLDCFYIHTKSGQNMKLNASCQVTLHIYMAHLMADKKPFLLVKMHFSHTLNLSGNLCNDVIFYPVLPVLPYYKIICIIFTWK